MYIYQNQSKWERRAGERSWIPFFLCMCGNGLHFSLCRYGICSVCPVKGGGGKGARDLRFGAMCGGLVAFGLAISFSSVPCCISPILSIYLPFLPSSVSVFAKLGNGCSVDAKCMRVASLFLVPGPLLSKLQGSPPPRVLIFIEEFSLRSSSCLFLIS